MTTNRDVTLINSDCVKALRERPDASVDGIVTDPPYEIGFNRSQWDSTGITYSPNLWGEALRGRKAGDLSARVRCDANLSPHDVGDLPGWLQFRLVLGKPFAVHPRQAVIDHESGVFEPIVLARKAAPRATPLNIDQCRDDGRWPSNVLLDVMAAQALDADAPNVKPSRFFYIAKAKPEEKDAGLAGHRLRARSRGLLVGIKGPSKKRYNYHPTVKPIALMQRLIRLIAPEGGVVLDPFGGSFTTGCAAMLESRRFVGIERDRSFFRIGELRVQHWREVARRGH